MADDLSVAMERLRTSTQRLNKACDSAALTVHELEEYLDSIHVGCESIVNIRVHAAGYDPLNCVCFGYMKHKGKFRFVITNEVCNETKKIISWSEASRDIKLDSFEMLPQLMKLIADEVDASRQRAEYVVSEVTAQLPLPKKQYGSEK